MIYLSLRVFVVQLSRGIGPARMRAGAEVGADGRRDEATHDDSGSSNRGRTCPDASGEGAGARREESANDTSGESAASWNVPHLVGRRSCRTAAGTHGLRDRG